MPSVEPGLDQLAALAALPQERGPVEMINLLRFRDAAVYAAPSRDEPCSGREAYARYGRELQPLLRQAGGRVVWRGSALLAFIGPADESWDEAIIVRYPDVAAFVAMLSNPGYRVITRHRHAALGDSRLIVTCSPAH